MFLRCNRRLKDGKAHAYWSVVESRRLSDGRIAQRQVLYPGEINASQREAWRKTIEVYDEGARRQVALFAADSMPADDIDAIGVRLSELRLERPRQWGACWLALDLWQQLELDSFWRPRLRPSREGTPWLKVLKTLVAYRLLDPGSQWRLHRQWFDASAMADLLDRLAEHKDDLFRFLKRRWAGLFDAEFDVLLYDLTSTYFEMLAGNTADSTTLGAFLDRIERRYGHADRIWVMDRGIPTEESLAKMRAMDASYLVGTPKGRLSRLEQQFLGKPWANVREGVQVKHLATEEDVYVLAQSHARIDKERGMRRKRLRRYIARLKALQGQVLKRDQLLMKLRAAKHEAGRAAGLIKVTLPQAGATTATLEFRLDRDKLRKVRRREGRYLLRTNLAAHDPAQLWKFYVQLTEVEQAFKELKHDLAVRPIWHRLEHRIEAHIFVAFLAYCLQVTLKARLKPLAGGLTPREVIAKLKTMQMVDVHVPTTDGRELVLSRYTQPEDDHRMLLQRLQLRLPEQPPPRITTRQLAPGLASAA